MRSLAENAYRIVIDFTQWVTEINDDKSGPDQDSEHRSSYLASVLCSGLTRMALR